MKESDRVVGSKKKRNKKKCAVQKCCCQNWRTALSFVSAAATNVQSRSSQVVAALSAELDIDACHVSVCLFGDDQWTPSTSSSSFVSFNHHRLGQLAVSAETWHAPVLQSKVRQLITKETLFSFVVAFGRTCHCCTNKQNHAPIYSFIDSW